MLRNTEFLKQMAGQIGISSLDLPTTTSKMATAMVTIGPIVLVYLRTEVFHQRHYGRLCQGLMQPQNLYRKPALPGS